MSAKAVKSFLKEKGIDTKDIRVSTASTSSLNVKLLDPKLDLEKIKNLLQDEFESYSRDEATGEILSGGNTFVFVEFDYNLTHEVGESLRSTVRPFLERCQGRWDMYLLSNHYAETMPSEYDKTLVRRAIREILHRELNENKAQYPDLEITGW